MEKNGFPGLAEHRREHQALVTQALQFQKDLAKASCWLRYRDDLSEHWLTNHIHKTDKKYGPFLNSKGVH